MGYDYTEQRRQQQQQQRYGSIKIYNIPFKMPGSQAQRELLHFYYCEAAGCFSMFSDPTLWTQLIPQRSQYQPVIRNALVALSSLYRDYILRGSSPLGESPIHIQLIAKSHRQLRLHLQSRDDALPETALICSLIFYIFECLVGNAGQAIWHLDQGLALLQRCWTEDPRRISANSTVYTHLAAVFARLDIHASAFRNDRAPILKLASPPIVTGLESLVSGFFLSLAHAEESLTVLQNWMVHHRIASIKQRNIPCDQVPPEFIHETLQLRSQFQLFLDAIEKLAPDVDTASQQREQQSRIVLLQLQAHLFYGVLLHNTAHIMPPAPEPANMAQSYGQYDKALAHITTILSSMHRPENRNPPSSNPGFTLSTNLVAGLYYICMKTKHRHVLQTALSLLQDPLISARDGLWDTGTAALVVQALVARSKTDGGGSELSFKLEEVRTNIVNNVDCLEGAVRMLQIEDKAS